MKTLSIDGEDVVHLDDATAALLLELAADWAGGIKGPVLAEFRFDAPEQGQDIRRKQGIADALVSLTFKFRPAAVPSAKLLAFFEAGGNVSLIRRTV